MATTLTDTLTLALPSLTHKVEAAQERQLAAPRESTALIPAHRIDQK
jgi:hypothetical protein